MAKTVKTQLMPAGRPIVFDFNVDGEVIAYETICPNCNTHNLIISLDKSRITCANTKCLSVMFVRLAATEADMSQVGWNI